MYIYGVFRREGDTIYGVLCSYRGSNKPALFANEEDAEAWADELKSLHSRYSYAVYKFNLNPNGFTSERVSSIW